MNPGDLVSGKYRLLRLLGSGGMGSVWAARNELTDRDFAVKFLKADLAKNKEALHRFFLEARACGQIKHPAIVDVYDMGQAEDGSPFLVMELLEGEGFEQRLARCGTFAPAEAAAWVAFIARGLEEAHARNLIHRDLKPGNIFFALDERGDVLPKVLDFGVSKALGPREDDFVKTTTGAVLGSPAYMSPEQAKGDTDVDHRSDVWSLGVILYESLAGHVPFDAPNYNALMVTIMMQPHRPLTEFVPGLHPELSAIVDQALAKDRSLRIPTARDLADRLESVVTKITGTPFVQLMRPNPSIPPPPGGRSMPSISGIHAPGRDASTTQGPWSGSASGTGTNPIPWLLGGVALFLAFAAGGFAVYRSRQPIFTVAGRSEAAITTRLARAQAQVRDLESATTASPPSVTSGSVSAPGAPTTSATAEPATSSAPAATGGAKTQRVPSGGGAKKSGGSKKSTDPHGGVGSAGF